MSKKKDRDREPDYIDDWLEYQDNRYNPGYYPQRGKFPNLGLEKPGPVATILIGVFIAAMVVVHFFIWEVEVIGSVLWVVCGGGMAAVFVASGISRLKEKKSNRSRRKR